MSAGALRIEERIDALHRIKAEKVCLRLEFISFKFLQRAVIVRSTFGGWWLHSLLGHVSAWVRLHLLIRILVHLAAILDNDGADVIVEDVVKELALIIIALLLLSNDLIRCFAYWLHQAVRVRIGDLLLILEFCLGRFVFFAFGEHLIERRSLQL